MMRKLGAAATRNADESAIRARGRARLLSGASGAALAAASVAVALGVSVAHPAHAAPNMTVNPTGGTYTQNANNNPITFGATTNITAGASTGIFGSGNATWNDTLLAGGKVQGSNGVYLFTAGSSFTNSGSITGTGAGGAGIYLRHGGNVTNLAGGNIAGVAYGVYLGSHHPLNSPVAGTVTNAAGGVIIATGPGTPGSPGVGVYIGSSFGGYVNNAGLIQGVGFGVQSYGAGGTVMNTGNITGATGIQLGGTGVSVASQAGAGFVTNSGNITGTNGYGVELTHGGNVTNLAGGNITGTKDGITGLYNPAYKNQEVINVTNAGLIQGTGKNSAGVYLTFGGNVTNQAGGVIRGNSYGVYIGNSNVSGPYFGNVTNAAGATITTFGASLKIGPGFYAPGAGVYVGKYAIATITNAGNISGNNTPTAGVPLAEGVFINGQGVVINSGNITGRGYGVLQSKYGVGNVTNSGLIQATGNATDLTTAGVAFTAGVSFQGNGTVNNLAGGTISGGVGVYADKYGTFGPSTVTNAGNITGTAPSVGRGFGGVMLMTGGKVKNSGNIAGVAYGVYIGGGAASYGVVTNATGATIKSTGASAPSAEGEGVYFANGTPGNVTNAGLISAVGNQSFGILFNGGFGTVTNSGTVTGGYGGVVLGGGGNVTQTAGLITGNIVGVAVTGAGP